MTKVPDQIAAKATGSPPEPAGEGALSVELTDLTELDLAELMTLRVRAGPSEESGDEEDKESDDEGENLEVAAGEDPPVAVDEQASEDESDADEAAVLSSGGNVIDPDFEPIDEEILLGSESGEVSTDDGLDAGVAAVENFGPHILSRRQLASHLAFAVAGEVLRLIIGQDDLVVDLRLFHPCCHWSCSSLLTAGAAGATA